MNVTSSLLTILACPKCRGKLNETPQEQGLSCLNCQLFYPFENGATVLLESEALPIKSGVIQKNDDKAKLPAVYFHIESGSSVGEVIQLLSGHCKAVGRSMEDMNSTQIFSMEPSVPLDDFTKKLVLNYLAKKKSKVATGNAQASAEADGKKSEGLGSFVRDADLVLNDPAISRLHAMLFNDDTGAGVLDLVSRNGTFVNGAEVESKPLKEGDTLEVGSTKMRFSLKKI